MQPSKSKYASSPWWNIYQPLGFKVATGDESPIGNKSQLTDLCKIAAEKGIDIIMDVVTNHLSQGEWGKLDGPVKNYEPEIYNNWLIHDDGATTDNTVREVVRGSLGGLPDLKTETTTVQNRVISMLKEYIDCGVKGFRFDAAKHIETKDDGEYKSDYWDKVIDTCNDYGMKKYNQKPFIYGEILYSPAAGRSWGSYTYHMSVVDNVQGKNVLNNIANNNSGGAAESGFSAGDNHPVLWAESHDTYENKNQETTHYDTRKINLAYAVQISRSKATALYFARPKDDYPIDNAPQVISGPNSDYKSALISSANKLHNDFVGGSENLYSADGKVINVRKSKDGRNEGALIVDPGLSNSQTTVTLNNLSDGTYTELISNKSVTVSKGSAKVQLTSGAAVLEKYTDQKVGPAINVRTQDDKTMFTDTLAVQISVSDATEAYYKINGVTKGTFTDSVQFTVGKNDPIDTNYKIEVFAKNADNVVSSYTLTVTKSDLASKVIVLTNVPEDMTMICWVWEVGKDGRWVKMERKGTTCVIDKNDLTAKETKFLFCCFPDGYSKETPDWSDKIFQTDDYTIGQETFDFDTLNRK